MAYGTDSGLTDWLAANGYTLPGSLTSAVLLTRASSYIDGLYGPRFTGRPTDITQTDAWPRTCAVAWGQPIANDAIPQAVVNAAYAAAYIEAGKPGILSPTYTPGTQKVLTEVGSLKWTVTQSGVSGAMAYLPVLPVVDGLLAPFLINGLLGRVPVALVV